MKEIEVTCKLGKELSADEIQTAAVKALGVSPKMKQQLKYRIVRRSIDARNDILYRYRIEVAKELLQTTALPVCDVAASVGFADAAYFCRVFKRSEKLPPTVWRASR